MVTDVKLGRPHRYQFNPKSFNVFYLNIHTETLDTQVRR